MAATYNLAGGAPVGQITETHTPASRLSTRLDLESVISDMARGIAVGVTGNPLFGVEIHSKRGPTQNYSLTGSDFYREGRVEILQGDGFIYGALFGNAETRLLGNVVPGILTNGKDFGTQQMRYNPSFADPAPDGSVARVADFTIESNEFHLHRVAKAVECNVDDLDDPVAVKDLFARFRQLQHIISDTSELIIWSALFVQALKNEKTSEDVQNTSSIPLSDFHKRMNEFFDPAHKTAAYAHRLIERFRTSIRDADGDEPDVLLTTGEVSTHITQYTELAKYDVGGPEGAAQLRGGKDTLRNIGGAATLVVNPRFSVCKVPALAMLMQQIIQKGDINFFPPMGNYMGLYDASRDDVGVISKHDALHHCLMWGEDGSIRGMSDAVIADIPTDDWAKVPFHRMDVPDYDYGVHLGDFATSGDIKKIRASNAHHGRGKQFVGEFAEDHFGREGFVKYTEATLKSVDPALREKGPVSISSCNNIANESGNFDYGSTAAQLYMAAFVLSDENVATEMTGGLGSMYGRRIVQGHNNGVPYIKSASVKAVANAMSLFGASTAGGGLGGSVSGGSGRRSSFSGGYGLTTAAPSYATAGLNMDGAFSNPTRKNIRMVDLAHVKEGLSGDTIDFTKILPAPLGLCSLRGLKTLVSLNGGAPHNKWQKGMNSLSAHYDSCESMCATIASKLPNAINDPASGNYVFDSDAAEALFDNTVVQTFGPWFVLKQSKLTSTTRIASDIDPTEKLVEKAKELESFINVALNDAGVPHTITVDTTTLSATTDHTAGSLFNALAESTLLGAIGVIKGTMDPRYAPGTDTVYTKMFEKLEEDRKAMPDVADMTVAIARDSLLNGLANFKILRNKDKDFIAKRDWFTQYLNFICTSIDEIMAGLPVAEATFAGAINASDYNVSRMLVTLPSLKSFVLDRIRHPIMTPFWVPANPFNPAVPLIEVTDEILALVTDLRAPNDRHLAEVASTRPEFLSRLPSAARTFIQLSKVHHWNGRVRRLAAGEEAEYADGAETDLGAVTTDYHPSSMHTGLLGVVNVTRTYAVSENMQRTIANIWLRQTDPMIRSIHLNIAHLSLSREAVMHTYSQIGLIPFSLGVMRPYVTMLFDVMMAMSRNSMTYYIRPEQYRAGVDANTGVATLTAHWFHGTNVSKPENFACLSTAYLNHVISGMDTTWINVSDIHRARRILDELASGGGTDGAALNGSMLSLAFPYKQDKSTRMYPIVAGGFGGMRIGSRGDIIADSLLDPFLMRSFYDALLEFTARRGKGGRRGRATIGVSDYVTNSRMWTVDEDTQLPLKDFPASSFMSHFRKGFLTETVAFN